ncbi:hypothetical protein C0995_012581 [Termitomyces sp. Mi166|nr:hypothetical protein C0995_012581 [Termitomyces sp. Mi166\
MSPTKLQLAVVAAACILNAGLTVTSGIWLYRRARPNQQEQRSSRSPSNSSTSRLGLIANYSEVELQNEGGGDTSTNSVPSHYSSSIPMTPTTAYQSRRMAPPDHNPLGSHQRMHERDTMNIHDRDPVGVTPQEYQSRRIARNPLGSRQPIHAAPRERNTTNIHNGDPVVTTPRGPVDISSQPTSISAEFSLEGDGTITMELVPNATDDQRQITTIVLQSVERISGAVTVYAVYDPIRTPWTSDNLSGLVTLWTYDRHRRCENLVVDLPTDQLRPGLPTPSLIPLPPHQLKSIVWTGHHNQLSLFFSQRLPSSINTLLLRCEVSLNDCERLLYWGRNSLRKFEVDYIRMDVEDALSGHVGMEMHMNYLTSFSVFANCDIFRLFERWHYPRLRDLHIVNSKPQEQESEVEKYFLTISPLQLISIQLRCAMTEEEQDWLRVFGVRSADIRPYM